MKLLVRNIARTITEKELREIFESYGAVQSCTIVMDKETGKSKGFGFVEIPKAGEAKAAVENLNGKEVEGSQIRVKKAEKKVEQKTGEKIVEKVAETEEKIEEKVLEKAKTNPWGK